MEELRPAVGSKFDEHNERDVTSKRDGDENLRKNISALTSVINIGKANASIKKTKRLRTSLERAEGNARGMYQFLFISIGWILTAYIIRSREVYGQLPN